MVSWESNGQDGSSYGIYAKRYNSSGVAQGGEFKVNASTANTQLNASGQFAGQRLRGGVGILQRRRRRLWLVLLQRYDSSGAALGGETLINTTTAGDQRAPAIVELTGGGFVAVWEARMPLAPASSASASTPTAPSLAASSPSTPLPHSTRTRRQSRR